LDSFLYFLSQRNKKPAERDRVSGPELLRVLAISGMHPRRRAMRVMVMAVMEMRQHD